MKKLLSITLALAVTLTLFVGLGVFAGTGDDTAQTSGNDVISYSMDFHKEATEDAGKQAFSFPGMTGELNYAVQSGDILEYDVKVVSKLDNVAVGTISGPLIDPSKPVPNPGEADQRYVGELKDIPGVIGKYNNRNLGGQTDLTVFADNEWYHQEVILEPLAGNANKQLWRLAPQASQIDATQALNGTLIVYFDNIRITNNGEVKKLIFAGQEEFNTFEINVGNSSNGLWGTNWVSNIEIKLAKDDVVYPSLAKDGDYLEVTIDTKENADFSKYRLGDIAYEVQEGDVLEYDVRLLSDVSGIGGIDADGHATAAANWAAVGNNWPLRDMNVADTTGGGNSHPGSALNQVAVNKWIHRTFALPAAYTPPECGLAGVFFDAFYLGYGGGNIPSGYAKVLYDNIVIKDKNGNVKICIFSGFDNESRLLSQDYMQRCEGGASVSMTYVHEATVESGATYEYTAREKSQRNETITYSTKIAAANGTMAYNGSVISYTPAEGFTGRDEALVNIGYDLSNLPPEWGAASWRNPADFKMLFNVTPKTETTTTAPAETTTTAPAETTTTAPAETTTTAPAETTTTAPAETTTTAPAETTTTAPAETTTAATTETTTAATTETTTAATTETTTAPTVEKKKIDYIQLDVNTKKNTANNSMYRIGDLGGYVIQEGDYIEWDAKLLKKVKGLGGIEINAVFLDSTKTETQDNKLLSELGYEGAKVDLTGSVGEWKKMSFPLKKTNAMVDAIWMAVRVDAGAMDGTASVLYDNIVIKNKNGEVVKTVYVNQDEWLNNQKFIMRCEGGAEGADCQAYLVHTVYADKNGTVDVTLPEKEGDRTIGYKISGQPKNGTLTLDGNKLTYVPGKDYTGMDGAIVDYVFADITDSVNPLKMKLNIAVDVDPEKVDDGNGGGDKPTTGETLPLLAMAMQRPASAIAIFAVKKGKKRG